MDSFYDAALAHEGQRRERLEYQEENTTSLVNLEGYDTRREGRCSSASTATPTPAAADPTDENADTVSVDSTMVVIDHIDDNGPMSTTSQPDRPSTSDLDTSTTSTAFSSRGHSRMSSAFSMGDLEDEDFEDDEDDDDDEEEIRRAHTAPASGACVDDDRSKRSNDKGQAAPGPPPTTSREIQRRTRLQAILDDLCEVRHTIKRQASTSQTAASKVTSWLSCLFHSETKAPTTKEIRFDDIQQLKWLGSGAHGCVFLGLHQGQEVAVKKYRELDITLKELETMKKLKHENVVEFKGYCTKPPVYCVIMEYCPRSLKDIISKCHVPPFLVLEWAKQIASGVKYLHEQNIVHRDLKSGNVLLAQDEKTLKISDFGCSTAFGGQSTNMSFTGTVAWMSPELIRSERCTEKVDVWSYGVVLWELLTGEVPYDGVATCAIILGVGSDSLHLPIPSSAPEGIALLLKQCWNKNPSHRPHFRQILMHLQILESDSSFADTPEEEYISLQGLWRKEIQYMFDHMKREEDKIKKQEEHLVRQREEELRHAQDIRQMYEEKLARLLELYEDLETVRDELRSQTQRMRHRHRKHRRRTQKRRDKEMDDMVVTPLSSSSLALVNGFKSRRQSAEADGEHLSRKLDSLAASTAEEVRRNLAFEDQDVVHAASSSA